MIRVAVFASGAGTNAIKLLETARTLAQVQIPLVIVDQVSSTLPLIIQGHPLLSNDQNLKVRLITPPLLKGTPSEKKKAHETLLLKELKENQIDWIFLAGYMRIVGPTLLETYPGKIVNIHPSLLPAYPGIDSYQRAFDAGDEKSGVTVHLVDSGIDTGPILKQVSFKRSPTDTFQDFMQNGKTIEWTLYPEILRTLDREGKL